MESFFVELTDIGRSHVNKEEIEEELQNDEALIKTEYTMISAGTELSRAYALKKGFKYPVRPGYCAVGKVIKAGKDLDVKKGDRVFFNAPHASLVKWKTSDSVQGPLIKKLDEDIDPIDATAMNLMLVALQGVPPQRSHPQRQGGRPHVGLPEPLLPPPVCRRLPKSPRMPRTFQREHDAGRPRASQRTSATHQGGI